MRYCGRDFTKEELDWLKNLIADNPDISRKDISIEFCKKASWLKPDGGTKDMSCRVALLKMDRAGRLKLPLPKRKHTPPYKKKRTPLGEPQPEVAKGAGQFNLELKSVSAADSSLWNELIDRYHYLGFKPLPGAQLRYFIKSGGKIFALLGFGAAAWTTAPRDNYIGWDHASRKNNLHLVVNNARFLILPWVRSKNLGSKTLSLASKQIAGDWERKYNYRPVLMETFVEKERFRGTCYKAANWIELGDTQGRGKLGQTKGEVPIKSVWVYPLSSDFRRQLVTVQK
jgi:hypothetical protein